MENYFGLRFQLQAAVRLCEAEGKLEQSPFGDIEAVARASEPAHAAAGSPA